MVIDVDDDADMKDQSKAQKGKKKQEHLYFKLLKELLNVLDMLLFRIGYICY